MIKMVNIFLSNNQIYRNIKNACNYGDSMIKTNQWYESVTHSIVCLFP